MGFLETYEEMVQALLDQGLELDGFPYRPDLVKLFTNFVTRPSGTRSDVKSFVHHVEMGISFDTQLPIITSFLPGIGQTMAAAAKIAAAVAPTVPPNPDNPNLDGDGNSPLYMFCDSPEL